VVRWVEQRLIVDDWNALASPCSLLLMPEMKTILVSRQPGSGSPDYAATDRIKTLT
jgi:hypothetical protein